jgi:hypothetical protein
VSKVDPAIGKMEPWRTFGGTAGSRIDNVGPPNFSADAYVYERDL